MGPVSGAILVALRAFEAHVGAWFHAAIFAGTVSAARAARIASNSIGGFISHELCRRERQGVRVGVFDAADLPVAAAVGMEDRVGDLATADCHGHLQGGGGELGVVMLRQSEHDDPWRRQVLDSG